MPYGKIIGGLLLKNSIFLAMLYAKVIGDGKGNTVECVTETSRDVNTVSSKTENILASYFSHGFHMINNFLCQDLIFTDRNKSPLVLSIFRFISIILN